jgi:hypothetical protein
VWCGVHHVSRLYVCLRFLQVVSLIWEPFVAVSSHTGESRIGGGRGGRAPGTPHPRGGGNFGGGSGGGVGGGPYDENRVGGGGMEASVVRRGDYTAPLRYAEGNVSSPQGAGGDGGRYGAGYDDGALSPYMNDLGGEVYGHASLPSQTATGTGRGYTHSRGDALYNSAVRPGGGVVRTNGGGYGGSATRSEGMSGRRRSIASRQVFEAAQQVPLSSVGAPSVSADRSVWQTATAADGRVYYYNVNTRETSWTDPNAGAMGAAPDHTYAGVSGGFDSSFGMGGGGGGGGGGGEAGLDAAPRVD